MSSPTTPPSTMKAWMHTRAGVSRDVLKLQSLPSPKLTLPDQVLVRISHCALNPAGSIVMQLLPFFFRGSPAIPEMDFAGTITEVGSEVPANRNLQPGAAIFGSIPLDQHVKSTSGGLAEYVCLSHTAVVRSPPRGKACELSGLGIAGATALKLMKAAKLKKGDQVLVNGASGGIGHLVVQMCDDVVGASGKVVAICSTNNVEWVKKYSTRNEDPEAAHRFEVIDYKKNAPVSSHLTKVFGNDRFDVVIDAVGVQDIFHNSPGFLKEGKPYVTVGPKASSYTYGGMAATVWTMAKNMLWPRLLGGTARPYVQVTAASNLESLEALAKMVEEDKLCVHVGTEIPMSDTISAYEQMLSGHAQGKIVVQISKNN